MVGSVYGCFFFFKQKTAYGWRISDWSSDVCSSDLGAGADEEQEAERRAGADHGQFNRARQSIGLDRRPIVSPHACWIAEAESGVGDAVDRKSVVEGKSVAVRVDLGCRRILKKKKQ